MQRRLRFTDASGTATEAAQFSDGVIFAHWPDGRAYLWLNAQAMEEDEQVTAVEWFDDGGQVTEDVLREQIAAEIEAVIPFARRDQPPAEAKAEAYRTAARIARGDA